MGKVNETTAARRSQLEAEARRTFAQAIAAWKAAGLTQREIAELVGAEGSTISKWLSGKGMGTLGPMLYIIRSAPPAPEPQREAA